MACDLVSEILGNECIGDSREKINDNFSALETAVCTLSTNTISVVDTTTIDLDYTSSSRIISGAVRTNSINDTHIQNNSITTNKIAPDTVRYSQLASWQSLSGTSLSAEALTQRVAKAWVNFNGTTSPPTIYSHFNVAGISKTAQGQYRINFIVPFLDAHYTPQITIADDYINGGTVIQGSVASITTDYIDIQVQSQITGVNGYDTGVYVVIFAS
jgi:hypothetical protein